MVVDRNDGVHRRLNDAGQLGLAFTQRFLHLFALRDVVQNFGETAELPRVVVNGEDHNVGPKGRAVFADP